MESEKGKGNWYVVHTYSGYEKKVKTNLEQKISSMGLENEIFEVRIPVQNEEEEKDGVSKQYVDNAIEQAITNVLTEEF